jgi:NAD+ synthase (glutamine-hydrolysing)
MRLVRVGVASVNTTVGAVHSNVDRALEVAHEAAAAGVTLLALQEQLVGGYPPEDMVQWRAFVDAQRVELLRFAAATAELGCVYVLGLVVASEAHLYNAAAVVHRGRVLGVVPKEKLPTYNIFYEARTLSAGRPYLQSVLWDEVPLGDLLFRFDWGLVGVEICEDLWSPEGPMRRRCYAGAELIVNVSASPYRLGVQATRREMIATRSSDNQCAIVYANAVGGQDGLVFDGGGLVCQNGRVVLEAARFRAGFEATVLDLDRTTRQRSENTTWRCDALHFAEAAQAIHTVTADHPGADRSRLGYPVPPGGSFFLPAPARPRDARAEFCEELLSALALGLGDYVEKNRFSLMGVALSGGRDSLLALLIAWRYATGRFAHLGGAKAKHEAAALLRAFYMPTRFSSEHTRRAAETVARELGVRFVLLPIEDAFERELEAARAMLQPGEALSPITVQNVQARLRALRMWSWANATGGLYLQTGNMSEKAVGYTTIGGDLEGGLSLIANVPKTVVMYLLDYLAETLNLDGIRQVLAYPAGPELAAGQEGEKELMPFPILDTCFALYAGEKLSPKEIEEALPSFFPDVPKDRLAEYVSRFHRLFSGSIYKWVQAPLAVHVGSLDLDRERALQLPVVSSSEWK